MEPNNNQPDKISKLEEQCADYLNGWKRAKADLINYQKDEQKRFEEMIRFSNETLIFDLLTILDNFDLAIASLEKQGAVDQGIYLIKSRLEDILKKRGLEKLTVAIGDQFDPALHEAVATEESDASSDKIVAVIRSGYNLNGKLIQPVQVKVTKSRSD